MASIYNIQTWQNSAGSQGPFKKNDIIKTEDGAYWYATKDHNLTLTPALTTLEWGGNISIEVDGSATINPYFFWAPSYNFSISHSPKIVELAFGDGYGQRLKDGINNDLLNFQLSFENRNEKESTAISHFFQQKEAYKSFFAKYNITIHDNNKYNLFFL